MSSPKDELKQKVAEAALSYIRNDMIIGVGTGSTVNFFIKALGEAKKKVQGAVSSSQISAKRLKKIGIPILELNSVTELPVYVDGADEINEHLQMIKGGGGALTGEKIIASNAKQFICIADSSKKVDILGKFPVAVEVIPMARSFVARQIVKLGGQPIYREGFTTDYGNVILDVHHLEILDTVQLEDQLNAIPGVVTNGIFAHRPANILLLGTEEGVETLNDH